MKNIKSSTIKKCKFNGEHRLECNVDWHGETKSLWITYPENLDDNIDVNSADWVLLTLLIPSMLSNSNLVIKGTVSPSLFYYATTDIQEILCAQNKNLNHIKINVEETKVRPKSETNYSGIGFSAGIDSLSSLALLNTDTLINPNYLATFNVGAMGSGDQGRNMLEKYSARLNEFCSENNYKPLLLDSNMDDFFKGLSYQSTHTIRTASAILSLGNAFNKYYYSSTFIYPSIGVNNTYDMSYADPILLPLFSTEATEFRPIGTHLSRLQKVKLVADFSVSYKYLDVCVGNPIKRMKSKIPNCSECWKCARQLMTLELLGKIELYSSVFDLDKYRRDKENIVHKHMLNALLPNRPNDIDVLLLAQEKGILRNYKLAYPIMLSSLGWKIKSFVARRLAKEYVKNTS